MNQEIRNSHGERLDYTWHEGDASSNKVVVIGHGVTGNKDRPFVVALAEGLAAAGINALRFSFAGNGGSEGRFVDCHVTKESGDLKAVLDALDGKHIAYAGHSMGGAVGVLTASEDSRIQHLISLAGMVDTKKFAETEFGDVTPDQGFMWDDEDCPLSQAYMDDLRTLNNLSDRAAKIHVPWFLVHGTEDDVVLIDDSKNIFEKANEPKELFIIEGANHVFADDALQPMIQRVGDWVKEQFQS